MSQADFELKTDESQLAGAGIAYSKYEYVPILPGKTISSASDFTSQTLQFNFEMGSNQWFDPRHVYLKLDVNFTKANGFPLETSDNLAPAMGLPSAFFSRIELQLENKTIDVIESSIQEIDAFLKRSAQSGYWLNNGEGASDELWQADFSARQTLYTPGSAIANVNKQSGQSLIWHLPLSVFRKTTTFLPVGKYRLLLSPADDYKQRIVQSTGANKVEGVDFAINITDCRLFVPTVIGKRVENLPMYLIDIERYNVQKRIVAANTSLQQLTFQVPESTFRVCVAFGYNGNNTLYPHSNFITSNNSQLQLLDLYVGYKGLNKPAPSVPQGQSAYVVDEFNPFNFRYAYTNATDDNMDPEGVDDYRRRGPYLMIDFNSDSSDKSTTLTVYFRFATAPTADSTNLLLMTMSRAVAKCKIQDNRCVNVETEDH